MIETNLRLRIGMSLVLGVVAGLVVAESATAQNGFKSQFKRRLVGDVELTGSIDASLLPGDVLSQQGGNAQLDGNPHGDDPGSVEETPASDHPSGPLGPGDPTTASTEPPREPTTKEEKLAVLDALIRQQERNIELMKKELADAQREKRNPDPKKLKQFATATGQRTQAFNGQSQYVKDLIDRFEREAPNKTHASILALGTMMGKLWQTHYKIEIMRSQGFIDLVKSERAKLLE